MAGKAGGKAAGKRSKSARDKSAGEAGGASGNRNGVSVKDFATDLVSAGRPPQVGTVIFVHGIGNKPEASVLKCQWDRALFHTEMGDRTRMVYWVDRERYPSPEVATCADGEQPRPPEPEWPGYSGASVRSLTAADADAADDDLSPAQRKQLAALAGRMQAGVEATRTGSRGKAAKGTVNAKVLPFKPVRNIVTRLLTRLFLHDVRDFFYDAARRQRMEDGLRERLAAGGGPFIVVAHSQGSMIAYNVLRQMKAADADVRLFVTIGSPLGIREVQDVIAKLTGKLAVPECVARWVNVAERLDPVALDAGLANDYAKSSRGVAIEDHGGDRINPDWQTNPHSATGYLSIDVVRRVVRETAGSGFAQVLARNVIVRDLVREIENGHAAQRFKTLIQLAEPGDGSPDVTLAEQRRKLTARIQALAQAEGASDDDIRLQEMQRFVSADLTRGQIERLRTEFKSLQIDRIWKNLSKRALITQSTHTVQARPAQLGYGASGAKIAWAVLDTGIAAGHPHFARHKNVVAQWDCVGRGAPKQLKPGDAGFDTLDRDGHGTHVAGIIAGSYAIDGESFDGMAPEARLYGFKVLDDNGAGEDAYVIKALDTIAKLNEDAGRLVIHGVNLSLGGTFDPSSYGCGHTPLCQELRRLWNQGVLVCIAAGNEGYAVLEGEDGQIASNMDLSIGDPANLEEAIAVGSVHKQNPHTYGVSFFSSRGPTADGRLKPDLVAPGERILSAAHDAGRKATRRNELYVEMSGTSQATPHVSGLLAGFLSVRREFIGYPNRVKSILLDHCTDLARDPYIQGRGMPNLVKMLLST